MKNDHLKERCLLLLVSSILLDKFTWGQYEEEYQLNGLCNGPNLDDFRSTSKCRKPFDIEGDSNTSIGTYMAVQKPFVSYLSANITSLQESSEYSEECGLYLASSTIPGGGVGLFAGKNYQTGESVGHGDICIPLIDFDLHRRHHRIVYPNPFANYVWYGSVLGMSREAKTTRVDAVCFGFGATPNSDPALWNLGMFRPIYLDSDLHRSKDPGAGAVSTYHFQTCQTIKDTPSGSELFLHYGKSWFEHRINKFAPNNEVFPLQENYIQANELLKKLSRITLNLKGATATEHASSLNNTIFMHLYGMVTALKEGPWYRSRTLQVFPDDVQVASAALQNYDGDIGASIRQPTAIRTLEYLAKHGRCQDHIRPGQSTLVQAGRGAFATRTLLAGTVITTSPLHHVMHREFANIYDYDWNSTNKEWLLKQQEIVGYQIMLNYCFSHRESTLLLCPYGAGVNYINHQAARANVRLQWAVDFVAGHIHAVIESFSIDDMKATDKPLIALDYVAIRDIKKGEELFIDYGKEWTAAWENHAHTFQRKLVNKSREVYQHARFWNTYFNSTLLRTEDEQDYDPYPDNLEIQCHPNLLKYSKYDATNENELFIWSIELVGKPCRILSRSEGTNFNYIYDVTIEVDSQSTEPTFTTLSGVPRNAISFLDRPKTTDLHIRQAFRHWIGLPDELFPYQWKNLRQGFSFKSSPAQHTDVKIKINRKK